MFIRLRAFTELLNMSVLNFFAEESESVKLPGRCFSGDVTLGYARQRFLSLRQTVEPRS